MSRTVGRYGWVPDLPDARDHVYLAPRVKIGALPASVDLRTSCPPVYDQGQLGSCTANAISGAIQFDQMKQKAAQVFTPSRLFIYYNERAIEGDIGTDGGASLRDGIKTVATQGACPETMWPYDEQKYAQKPPVACYKFAKQHPAVNYARLTQDGTQLKTCLASGLPFVFGFTVYQSFESDAVAHSGVVAMPDLTNESALGGHAVMAVGFEDSTSRFLVRNSWGSAWGMGGYFTIPYDYVLNASLADDFWTIRLVK